MRSELSIVNDALALLFMVIAVVVAWGWMVGVFNG